MTTKQQPLFRVFFHSATTDSEGQPTLSQGTEIGAVWPRKGGKEGAIMRLNLVPENLAQGAVLLYPPKRKDERSPA